jgi:hypothetical protein
MAALVMYVVVGAVVPAIASAHHVDAYKSWATCTQVGVKFVGFQYGDGPVTVRVRVDGTLVTTATVPKFSGDKTVVLDLPVLSAGTHTIRVDATWPTQGSNNGTFTKTVHGCPGPPPPPVYDCDGNQLPPGSTPPTDDECNPPPPPEPPAPPPVEPPSPPAPPVEPPSPRRRTDRCPSRVRFMVRKPHPSITHGVVKFTARRVNEGRILKTRWWINGTRLRDENSASLNIGRRTLTIALWRQDVWRYPNIWGVYRMKVTVKTRCGWGVERLRYFNQDPPVQ